MTRGDGVPGGARLLVAAGISGAAVMLMELTATRALAPAFGASLYTWTNVIGVVLLALTLGYVMGGHLADRRPQPDLLGRILLGAALLSVPAPFLAVPLGEWLLPEPEALSALRSTGHVIRGSLAATLILFAPPLFLLGMVGPFVARCLMDTGLGGGTAAGRTLAVSTLGSVVGTYLPAHLLIPSLGSRGTLLTASALLAVAGVLLVRSPRARVGAAALLLAIAAGAVLGAALPIRGPLGMGLPRPGGPFVEVGLLEEQESPYQYVRITSWERAGDGNGVRQVRLSLDEGVLEFHSVTEGRIGPDGEFIPQTLTGGLYYDMFALLPELVTGAEADPTSVAILGGGAGTMGRILRETQGERVAQVVSIEIDAQVAALHERFGWAPGPRDRVLVGDGRVVLRQLDHRFDVIILDAYARQLSIPAHLATREFFALARTRLSQRGVFAMNVSVTDLESPLFRALQRTLGEVFPNLHAVCIPGSWNVMIVASQGAGRLRLEGSGERLSETRRAFRGGLLQLERDPKGGRLLTDDRAPLEQLARRS